MMATDHPSYWSPGDQIVFRQVHASRVWAAIPSTVIEDSKDLNSVYVAPGTKVARPACDRGEYLRVAASGNWNLIVDEWIEQYHVWASIPGEVYSIWTMWGVPDWRHLGWKMNLQTPIKRTHIGFDTMDHVLDATISADLSSWEWKDEDEFEEAITLGLFTDAEGERIRREALRAITTIMNDRRDQLRRWVAWRPPTGWKLPGLVDGWDVV